METLDEFPAPAGHHTGTQSYIDAGFYENLIRSFTDWEKRQIDDPVIRDQCRMLLEREARLLDEGRFEEWLALYSPQCVYWVPASPAAGDPRREVAVMFDDRRRLEDRIYRLRTGYAWSQAPASRTVRLVSNVEVFANLMVRSSFLIAEFRAGETRVLAGWCGHRLKRGDRGLEIEVKQVNLIDCDQNLRNPSILF